MNDQQESRLISLLRGTDLPERKTNTDRISFYKVTMRLRFETIETEVWAKSPEDAVFMVYRSKFDSPGIEIIYHLNNRVFEVKNGGAWGADAYVDRTLIELYETGWKP